MFPLSGRRYVLVILYKKTCQKLELIVGRIFFNRKEVDKDAFLYEAPGLAGFLPLRIN